MAKRKSPAQIAAAKKNLEKARAALSGRKAKRAGIPSVSYLKYTDDSNAGPIRMKMK